MKQKLLKLSLILGIFAVLMAISCTVNAATYDIYTYTTNGTGLTITGCKTDASGSITIPKTINGYTVTSIGSYAFEDCTSLTTITIPDGVTSIGKYAFSGCASLTTITIPDSVTSIGEYAFRVCTSLTTITIPDSVTSIGDWAFCVCTSLTTITIPDSVTSIGGSAFYNCTSLTTITIPDGVTSIGSQAFYSCTSLTTITIPDSVTSIGYEALENCTRLTTITIPDGVTSIGYDAFYGCTSLTTITIPDSVTRIGSSAFSNTGIYNENSNWKDGLLYIDNHLVAAKADISGTVNLRSGLLTIANTAFRDCTSLTTINIPNSVTSIGSFAFDGCTSLTTMTIPDGVTSIGSYAFRNCTSLTTITIPDGVTSIGGSAFEGCTSLTTITIPDSVTSIGSFAFCDCASLTTITIPDGVTSIGKYAFYNCTSLTTITIPDGVTSIGSRAFYNCTTLTTITIPDGVTSIGEYAFYNCTSLTTITIPDGVTSIGSRAFYNCTRLKSVYYHGTEEEWDKISIGYYNSGLESAQRHYVCDVNIFNTAGELQQVLVVERDKLLNVSDYYIDSKLLKLYVDEDRTVEFDYKSVPVNGEMDLYLEYIQLYTYKFLNDDGTILKEETITCGSVITLPENPVKDSTAQYTYIFAGWDGYTEGMTLMGDVTFSPMFTSVTNKYTYKFLNENGTVLKEEIIEYGSVITLPENPVKEPTAQYTYTFAGWDGYTEGMTLTEDITFTPEFTAAINQYTYKFTDSDGNILKEETVDYGTVISVPQNPADKDPYTFDYWQGYTNNMPIVEDVVFEAVYKYKKYYISCQGISGKTEVVYASEYTLNWNLKDDYVFCGYYTEADGKGTKLTDESGKSLGVYGFAEDITAYPYYLHTLLNKVSISGVKEVSVGTEAIELSLSFATDKAAKYLTCTIKYQEYLEMTNLLGKDFALANINSTKVSDGYKYSTITCMYDYAGGLIPVNKEIIPFVMKFNVPQTASAGVANIEACDVVLLGDETYSFESGASQSISILPKLCERIEISGPQYIDEPSKYTASVYPEYTSNKSVVWSVSDEGIAKISEQGILTPVKNGRVTIYATAADGSGVYGSITVDVLAYAKIESLTIDGVWNKEFSADVREYTVYLKEDADFVNVKAVYNGGTLFANGMLLLPGFESSISIADSETVIEFIRKDAADMTDSMYTITFVKFEGTKTEVSADGKAFEILPVNLEEGGKIILSLYNGDKLVEFKTAVFEDASIHFETEKAYTKAKVMAWESLNSLKAVCDSEMLK